jgi:hypothetical protein
MLQEVMSDVILVNSQYCTGVSDGKFPIIFYLKYPDWASTLAMLPNNRSLPYEKCRGTLHILLFNGRFYSLLLPQGRSM